MTTTPLFLFLLAASSLPHGELRFAVHHDPKTLHPLLAADDAAEAVRYLTSAVLIRVNRSTKQLEPELAQLWKTGPGSRSIHFELRPNITFSDGTPFTAADVAATVAQLTDRSTHPPAADSFTVSGVLPNVSVDSPHSLTLTFGGPVSGLERLFDQLSIVSASSPLKERASLGPFVLSAYRPGIEILLTRNPHYWKKDASGQPLPYLETVRIAIQQNREIELNRFRRGELDLINSLAPEPFDRLAKDMPQAVHDAGPSTGIEFLWFNLAPNAVTPYKNAWFANANFRHAVSLAINRDDLARVVYHGHAVPARGIYSPANRFWFNTKLPPASVNLDRAHALLATEGFRKKGDRLTDRAGNPVEFSLITSAGNANRERMAALIQQDLQKLGIVLNLVTLDTRSLIERITKSANYEACLLGLTNVDPDPNELANVLLSSGPQHAWNPSQKTPATAWEAEIDTAMRVQQSAPTPAKRKESFDRVQEILHREEPYLFLVHSNSLSAVSPRVRNAQPVPLFPETFWNAERLALP